MAFQVRSHRRGVSTLWIIASAPALLTVLVMVTDIGNVWRARVELETALEAAALAAVQQWGQAGGGPTVAARNVGIDFAAANTVAGAPVILAANYNGSAPPNENATCDGNLVFAAVTNTASPYTLNAGMAAMCVPGSEPAVRARATTTVDSFWNNLFGIPVGPYGVSAQTTARYRCDTGRPELILVEEFICP